MTWFISKPTSAEDSDTPHTQTRTRLSAGPAGHTPPTPTPGLTPPAPPRG